MSENSNQAWRRWFGLLFLALAFGMLVWGQTVLKGQLTGAAYLIYWTVCFLFTFLAIFTALLDILLVRRQSRIDRRELLKKTFTGNDPASGDAGDEATSKRETG